MLKHRPLSEVLFDCLFRNCRSFHHYHPCIPCPSSMLYLLPVGILHILLFYFLSDTFSKNASSTRGCLLLNPWHLEDSMAYNWLPSNICWMNGCVPWFQLQFLYGLQMCFYSLGLFPRFKIHIFNHLFESTHNIQMQNSQDWIHYFVSLHFYIISSTSYKLI